MSFANDSASPVREDMPIQTLIELDEMDREIDAFLDQDDIDQMLLDTQDDDEILDTAENGLREDWGVSDPNLLTFFENFKSSKKYIVEHTKFLLFHEKQTACSEADLIPNIVKYFKDSYAKKTNRPGATADGLQDIKLKASTTLRGVFSVLIKFWQYTGRGELKKLAPLVTDLLGQWDKDHRTKQSATFTREHITRLLSSPDCPKMLLNKTYAVVSLALAGRGIEAYNVCVGDVTRVEDGEGK
ncbi:hypothetical protein B484DRAFT_437743, partial [Ochromonadaceae sp. CCMP2298]